jgi:hypothetical protein
MGKDLYLHADIDSGTAEYSWNGPNGYSANQPHPIRYNVLKDAAGTYNITVTRDGCSTIGQVLVVIDDAGEPGDFLELNPNPNHGNLTLRGQLRTDQSMPLTIMNSLGQIIYTDIVRTNNKILDTQITMPDVAAGAYYLRIMVSGKRKSFRFVVSK